MPIIIYFSHKDENMVHGEMQKISKGNTAVVADKIAEQLNIEAVELAPLKKYPESYQEMVDIAKKEKMEQARPGYCLAIPDLSDYNEIIIGYPNWWGTYPMIIASFLEDYDLSGKTLYPFCTHEGSALGSSMDDLRKSCPGALIEQGLAIHGSKVEMAKRAVTHWITRLI
ncbi:flavodoxin [Oceanobacillus locisalsi]|uniref:Flavodoxin n=1 Tax=Oceanobacillus locisalsi TaxID=546107 RepID=A0ABW3NGQ0_9BACI